MRRRQATRQEAAKGQGKSSESREAIRFSAVKSQLRGVTRWAISRKRRSGFKGLARRGGQDRDFRGPLKDTRSFVSARTSAFIDLRNADGGPSSSMLFSSASCRRTRQGPGRSRDSVTRVYTDKYTYTRPYDASTASPVANRFLDGKRVSPFTKQPGWRESGDSNDDFSIL